MLHITFGAKKKSENLDLASLSNRLGDRGATTPLTPYYTINRNNNMEILIINILIVLLSYFYLRGQKYEKANRKSIKKQKKHKRNR